MSYENIKRAFDRNAKALKLRPGLGQGTATTRVRSMDGLTCQVEEGDWKLTVDMGEKSGGNGAGPNPGVLGRGALGSCLVISYLMWAANLDIPIDGVEVEIQADYDAGGHYGVSDERPGYQEVRYRVIVDSEADEAEILHLLDVADAHTSYLDVFSREQPLKREVVIRGRSPR